MEDIIKSIKATLYERVSNPFILSFLMAWCIHNYRVIMIIISNESLNIKLVNIDLYFNGSFMLNGLVINYGCILHSIIIPLIYSLIYIYALPVLSKRIIHYHFKMQRELLSAKHDAEGLELLTKEKSRELRQYFILLEKELKDQIEKLEEENAELKSLIKTEANEVPSEEFSQKNEDETIELTENEIKILVAFSGVERRSVNDVAKTINLHLDAAKFICAEFVKKDLLLDEGNRNSSGLHYYSLAHLGRKFLTENNLV